MSAPSSVAKCPEVVVIDYGMGNLRSVVKALEHVGASVRVVETPGDVGGAAAVVFPGQGAIVDAMVRLRETGFDAFLRDWIAADRPFFGICLGLQVLFDHSEEGDTPCLGIWPGKVVRFRSRPGLRVPHMGWNAVRWRDIPGAQGLGEQDYYFVHSYRVETPDPTLAWGTCDYDGEFVAAAARGNAWATQFHPEKSQAAGLALYRAFLRTLPAASLSRK